MCVFRIQPMATTAWTPSRSTTPPRRLKFATRLEQRRWVNSESPQACPSLTSTPHWEPRPTTDCTTTAAASCWPWAPAPSSCVSVNSAIPDLSRTPRATAAQAVTSTKQARRLLRPRRTTRSRRRRTRTWHGRCRSACSPMSEDKTLTEPHQEPHVLPETFQILDVLCFGWNPTWNTSSIFSNKQRVFVHFLSQSFHSDTLSKQFSSNVVPWQSGFHPHGWFSFFFVTFFYRLFIEKTFDISLQMSFHDNQWLHRCFFWICIPFSPNFWSFSSFRPLLLSSLFCLHENHMAGIG